ncbi:MAG: GMP reductase [Bacilli bacterium]
MRIENELKLDFSDVLIRPKRSTLKSRKDVDLFRTYKFLHAKGRTWTGIPIMASNMDGVGTLEMALALQSQSLMTVLVKSYNVEDIRPVADTLNPDLTVFSTGVSETDLERLKEILKTFPKFYMICIDVANGYSEFFAEFVSKIRSLYPQHIIIAGNVVTGDMTQELILRGADIVKVGIGPGSVCTTRIQTGVGYPQLSAIIECAEAAHGMGALIIADGGCTSPGDVAKAFGGGADFVMLGGMLAGHDEGGGQIETVYEATGRYVNQTLQPETKPTQFIRFYGMSSDTAMTKNNQEMANYRSSEGRTVMVPYRGKVLPTIQNILGGLRSTCTYVGAKTLKELPRGTTFIRVQKQFNDVFAKK